MLRSSSARYSTASHAEHFIHRPSGTERVRRSVLIREGMIFSNQVIRRWVEAFGAVLKRRHLYLVGAYRASQTQDPGGTARQLKLRVVFDCTQVKTLGRRRDSA